MSAKQAILAALPGSQVEIAERTDLRLATVCDWLAVLTSQHEAHICDWKTQARGGKPIAIYQAGPGHSKPRPAMTINAVRSKTSRLRRILQ